MCLCVCLCVCIVLSCRALFMLYQVCNIIQYTHTIHTHNTHTQYIPNTNTHTLFFFILHQVFSYCIKLQGSHRNDSCLCVCGWVGGLVGEWAGGCECMVGAGYVQASEPPSLVDHTKHDRYPLMIPQWNARLESMIPQWNASMRQWNASMREWNASMRGASYIQPAMSKTLMPYTLNPLIKVKMTLTPWWHWIGHCRRLHMSYSTPLDHTPYATNHMPRTPSWHLICNCWRLHISTLYTPCIYIYMYIYIHVYILYRDGHFTPLDYSQHDTNPLMTPNR